MRILGLLVMMALLAGPAYAQQGGEKQKSPQQIQSERDAEMAYKRSLSNIPDQGPTDPWGNVRSDAPPKAAKTPAAKRVKSGSTVN